MNKVVKWFSRLLQKKKLNPLRSPLGCEQEFNREINFDRWRDDLSQYDVVDLTPLSLSADTTLAKGDIPEALRKPPLYDFVFKIKDGEGYEVVFLLHCYGKRGNRILADNGRAYIPLLDIVQLDEKYGAVSIMQILTPKAQYMQVFEVRPVASALERVDDEILDAMNVTADAVLWHYAYMAKAFRNRPDCFIVSKHDGHRQLTAKPESTEPLHTVEVVHKVYEEPTKPDEHNVEEGRKIACPYWTVSGHYRTLKSGKTIWIEPYAKGKDRNNPERNVPKTYNILERSDI